MNELKIDKIKRFNYLSGEIDAVYHEVALRFGMSDSAMLVLYTICNRGESCLISDIVRLSGVSKQTINSAIRGLESEGIVYLEAAGVRQKQVCLTAQGRALAERTVMRLLEIENDILASWTKEEQELYFALTERFLTSFKSKTGGL